jgi:hypothetical protein
LKTIDAPYPPGNRESEQASNSATLIKVRDDASQGLAADRPDQLKAIAADKALAFAVSVTNTPTRPLSAQDMRSGCLLPSCGRPSSINASLAPNGHRIGLGCARKRSVQKEALVNRMRCQIVITSPDLSPANSAVFSNWQDAANTSFCDGTT